MRSTLASLALALLATAAHAAPRVAICASDANKAQTDIQTKLNASGAFAAVDIIDCGASTPTLNQLKAYEGVLTFSNLPYRDRAALGTVLADYVDAGGGVVQLQFGISLGFNLELLGRWSQENYHCIAPSKILYQQSPLKPQPVDPNHPLVQGITGITSQYRGLGPINMARGARSLWDFADGAPGVCLMMVNGRPRVDLNFYPGPPPMYYTEAKAGDGALLMKNALLAVAGGFNPLKGTPNPVAFPDTGTGAVSNPITVTYTNGGMAAQTATAISLGGTHAGDFLVVKAPPLPVMLAPMGTLTVEVAFQPQAGGARSATLKVAVANQMSTADVTLTGNGLPAQVKVTPFPVDMGGTQIGTPRMRDVTIANTGGGKVIINEVKITSGNAAFSLSNMPIFPVALGPGASFPATLTFAPQSNGLTNGVLTVTSNDPNTPTIHVPVSGYAGPPGIALDVGSLAFGNINVGASTTQPITVTNSGFSDLVVSDIALAGANAGDFTVDKMMAVGTIGAQQSQKFAVTFKPGALGNRFASVTVKSNAGDKSAGLFGTGTSAMMALSPKAIDFGNAYVKTKTMPRTLTISNMGSGTLKVMSLAIAGMGASSFAAAMGAPMAPFDVGPNASRAVDFVCTPQAMGALSATLTVASDVGSDTVALSCTGDAPLLKVTPNPVDYGQVAVQGMAAVKTVTLENAGTADLTISFFNVAGADQNDFVVKMPPKLPLLLKPMTSAQVDVEFSPSRGGIHNAEIQLITDDPMAQNPRVPLTGHGIVAGIEVTPNPLDFGPVVVGATSAAKAVSVKNTGDLPLTVDKLTLGGPSAALFAIDSMAPLTIGKGETAAIGVTFKPVTVGNATATLTIVAGQLVPVVVTLRGNGTAPTLGVSPAALDFGAIEVGAASEPQPVTVKNGGATPLTIASIASSDPAFAIDQTGATLTLAPMGTTTFTVTFRPSAEKMATATIGITLANGMRPAAQLSASGTGVAGKPAGGCGVAARRAAPTPLVLLLGSALLLLARRRRRG